MKNPAPLIVQTHLQLLNLVGGLTGWGSSYNLMPPEAGNDNFVAVQRSVGLGERTVIDKDTNTPVDDLREGIQIRVRSHVYLDGENKIEAIRQAIVATWQKKITVNGTDYLLHNFQMIGPILRMGQDDLKRENFSSNWLAVITEL